MAKKSELAPFFWVPLERKKRYSENPPRFCQRCQREGRIKRGLDCNWLCQRCRGADTRAMRRILGHDVMPMEGGGFSTVMTVEDSDKVRDYFDKKFSQKSTLEQEARAVSIGDLILKSFEEDEP